MFIVFAVLHFNVLARVFVLEFKDCIDELRDREVDLKERAQVARIAKVS